MAFTRFCAIPPLNITGIVPSYTFSCTVTVSAMFAGITSVGEVVRLHPAWAVPEAVPVTGDDVPAGPGEPVHPARRTAVQRSIASESAMVSCIPERASRCYMMLALGVPAHLRNFVAWIVAWCGARLLKRYTLYDIFYYSWIERLAL